MKRIALKYIGVFLVLLSVFSCEREYEEPRGSVRGTAPVFNTLASSEWNLSRPSEGEDPFVVRVGWSPVKYAYENSEYIHPKEVSYTLEMDLLDGDFSNPQIVAETTGLYHDFHTRELKELTDALIGEDSGETRNYHLRVRASSSEGEVISEPLLVSIQSFLLVDPTIKSVFLIGDMNGWDASNTDYLLFRNSNDYTDGVYTYTGYFSKPTYFKMVAEEYLGGYENMYCAGENGTLLLGDFGAFYVEAGYHTITIDIKQNTWRIEDFDGEGKEVFNTLGPIGGFSGWDNEPHMTQSTFDPHQWRLTYEFTEPTAVKFRANHDWSKNWGAGDKDIPYGLSYFDGPGASLNDVGVYDIYFNDLTGHYALIKK